MKVLVLLSGGVDSATCLGMAVHVYSKENVIGLSISYGQKHDREIDAAKRIAEYYQVEIICLDLAKIFEFSDCSLFQHSESEIPKETYAEQLEKSGGKPVSTYVPFRNGLFLSAAASVALSKGCGIIYYGAHGDDAAGNAYPDCSSAFQEAMNKAVTIGSGEQLKIEAPFVASSKSEVVRKGLELGVPYELTWSCYQGAEEPCGACATCMDRAAAFEKNGVIDPASIGVRKGI